MLILTRKPDEEIKIGSNITVKILSISEGQVKLGITAPPDVEIFRNEVYERVKQVTIEASKQSSQKPTDTSRLNANQIRKISNGQ